MSRSLPPLPDRFRGTVLTGPAAAEAASRVSGPFHAAPSAFVSPEDPEDLARLVSWAAAEGIALTARGGGTGMPGGNLGHSVVVSLGGPFDTVAVDPDDRQRIRTGAGATAAAAERLARSLGRRLPFLPSSARWCTTGGMAANNAAGARSFRYGPAASWIRALEGVDARGKPFRLEGRGGPRPDAFGTPRGAPAEGAAGQEDIRDREGAGAPEVVRGPEGTRAEDPRFLLAHLELPTHPDGLAERWPRVRKNSSGYALDRFAFRGDPMQLFVGSEGTLALLTAVDWRTQKIPPAQALVLLPARSTADTAAIARGAAAAGASACEFLGRRFLDLARLEADPVAAPLASDAWGLLLVAVEGEPEEVEARLEEVLRLGAGISGIGPVARAPDEVERLWALRRAASPTIAREARHGRISTQFIEDCVVPIDVLSHFLDGLDEILQEARFDAAVFGHAGDGNIHVNPLVPVADPDWEARVRQVLDRTVSLVSGLGGTLSGEHGDGRIRAPFLEDIWDPSLVAAFRRIKQHFDPAGILNPGVILAGAGQDPLEGFQPRPRVHPPT